MGTDSMSGFQPRSISLAAASDKNESLLISGSDTGNQREFRTLRSATQGSALRTRKPFEKGLSENSIVWRGANR